MTLCIKVSTSTGLEQVVITNYKECNYKYNSHEMTIEAIPYIQGTRSTIIQFQDKVEYLEATLQIKLCIGESFELPSEPQFIIE